MTTFWTEFLNEPPALRKSVAWQNVEFLHSHQKEFDTLVATVMFIPKLEPPGSTNAQPTSSNNPLCAMVPTIC